jgi:predicted nuclease with TOPRIM domain
MLALQQRVVSAILDGNKAGQTILERLLDCGKNQEELKRGQEEVKRGQEELKRGQDELKEELRRGLEELKRGQEELKRGQEEVKRGLDESKRAQDQFKKLLIEFLQAVRRSSHPSYRPSRPRSDYSSQIHEPALLDQPRLAPSR